MNKNQAIAISHAISHIRPGWPQSSVLSMLEALPPDMRDRPARDVMLALTWVAYDPATTSPGRIKAAGPWWGIHAPSETCGKPLIAETVALTCDHGFRPARCERCNVQAGSPVPPADIRAQMRADIRRAQDRPQELT